MTVPGNLSSPLLATAADSAAADFQIDRSLRFDRADSANLSRTPSSESNRRTWTWSAWVKRSDLTNSLQGLFGAGVDDYDYTGLYFQGDELKLEDYPGGGIVRTDPVVLRDASAWYHITIAVDTTQSAAADRVKFYLNGVQLTTSGTWAQNTQTRFNKTQVHKLGKFYPSGGSNEHFTGYLAEINFVDGQQLAPTDFGRYDSNNVWQPKQYSGTYGTNGFRLTFSDNSSNAALGTDSSGNSNTWTVNNLSATNIDYIAQGSYTASQWDSTNKIDHIFDGNDSTLAYRPNSAGAGTSTFTFGTTVTVTSSLQIRGWKGDSNERIFANGVDISSHFNTQSGGGLSTQNVTSTVGSTPFTLTSVGSENQNNRAGAIAKIIVDGTTLISEGAEVVDSLIDTPTNYTADSGNNGGNYCTMNPLLHVRLATLSNGNLDVTGGSLTDNGWGTIAVPSGKWYAEVTVTAGGGSTDVMVGVKDIDQQGVTDFGAVSRGYGYSSSGQKVNSDSLSSYAASYTNGDVIGIALDLDAGTITFYKNGSSQGAAFSGISSSYSYHFCCFCRTTSDKVSWNFGQRSFAYTPPSNHLAVCTTNLPDPTIADGSTAFDIDLYTGTNASLERSNFAFSPDFLWFKSRNAARTHVLIDTVRGRAKALESNNNAAEFTSDANRDLVSFDNDGFTVGQTQNFSSVNRSGDSIVVWAWDAGTSTASNTDGSITSSVRANASAGISIVGFTGNGSAATIGHGLNAAPELILLKNRQTTQLWYTYHKPLGANKYMYLNSTSGAQSDPGMWNNVEPTSSVFTVGSYALSNNYIAYCFTSVAGFSAFGSYTGNGSTDGTFVFTGMRPKWLLLKRTDSTKSWQIIDTERSAHNVTDDRLFPDDSGAESSSSNFNLDILSNGFKCRTAHDSTNVSGGTYIYAAFAEHPFKTARAR